MNEEYVEKETEFDVNEEDVEPQIRCADCVCRQLTQWRLDILHTKGTGTSAVVTVYPAWRGPLGILRS